MNSAENSTVTRDPFVFYVAQQARAGKLTQFIARGQSMRPLIPDGCTVVLAPIDRLSVGDVVLAVHHGQPILHRIQWLQDDGVWLRGDLNRKFQHCKREAILAVAIECFDDKFGKRPLRWSGFNRLWTAFTIPAALRIWH